MQRHQVLWLLRKWREGFSEERRGFWCEGHCEERSGGHCEERRNLPRVLGSGLFQSAVCFGNGEWRDTMKFSLIASQRQTVFFVAKVIARNEAKVIARNGAGVIARNEAIFLVWEQRRSNLPRVRRSLRGTTQSALCFVRDFFRVQFASAMGSDGTQWGFLWLPRKDEQSLAKTDSHSQRQTVFLTEGCQQGKETTRSHPSAKKEKQFLQNINTREMPEAHKAPADRRNE